LPVIYILVLGIFFTEDSTYTKVMHYDQDTETKGWMVLLILVYNMMGASQVVPIYMFVKILYSAFLFLHGWNQFITYLQRGDYGVVRLLQDLFRLNVMAVLLCLCMNRPYQFYEFIPLISFWTFIVYVSLSIPPRITWTTCETNSLNYLYLILKLVGIFSFTTILYISEVFFEKVFVTRPWKALFVTTDDDIRDWWMRWKIDRYSMPSGMVLALAYHLGRKYKILEDDNHGNLFSTRISLSAILFSLLGIAGYGVFSVLCRNQLECVEIHSYVTFIPITSYILLRNVSGMLRTRFSAFFSWFGQIWVELLVGQYHIWQGADGHGVLVLVPAYPVGNVLLTALVFACAAHEVRKCTDVLLPYAVPEDWRKALRNMCLFLLVLVPIGINDGMF